MRLPRLLKAPKTAGHKPNLLWAVSERKYMIGDSEPRACPELVEGLSPKERAPGAPAQSSIAMFDDKFSSLVKLVESHDIDSVN